MAGRRRMTVFIATVVIVFALVVAMGTPASGQGIPLPPPLGPPPEQPPPERPPPEQPPPQRPPPPQQQPPPDNSAYPPLPHASGAGRRVVYCVSCQRVWIVEENGQIVRSYLVSGRYGIPKPATYQVFSRSRLSRSGSLTLAYMVRFARGRTLRIGFHQIPERKGRPIQSESELGRPRSHGCVRQARRDAAFLWNWAPIGTRVVVTR